MEECCRCCQQPERAGADAWRRGLHQAGRRVDALARFREAEEVQAERQPAYPLLYSLSGFRYCELLAADAERAAWLAVRVEARPGGGGRSRQDAGAPRTRTVPSGVVEGCREVEQRAEGAQRAWREIFTNEPSVFDIARDHLTLDRAGLYRAILERGDGSGVLAESAIETPSVEIEQAVDGLRRAGQLDDLPRGLLTRAWLRSWTGDADGARADLDEAGEIAERGSMPLFQADVQLYRARLFGDGAALAEARRLIEKHGYDRRLEELVDAEEAARS